MNVDAAAVFFLNVFIFFSYRTLFNSQYYAILTLNQSGWFLRV